MAYNGWVQLAYAIIELAAQDYRASRAGETIDTKNAMPSTLDHKFVADECRSFFLSKWFSVLSMSAIDGEELIRRLDDDVRRGWKKPRERRKGSFL